MGVPIILVTEVAYSEICSPQTISLGCLTNKLNLNNFNEFQNRRLGSKQYVFSIFYKKKKRIDRRLATTCFSHLHRAPQNTEERKKKEGHFEDKS
jgi:hypothetical protein